MAVRDAVRTKIETWRDDSHVVAWSGLLNTDTGEPIEMVGSSDRSVQVSGTFGVGGTCLIEGSNNGVNYHTLTDPQGSDLSFGAAGLEQIMTLPRWIRPRISAGDGDTALVVTMLLKLAR